MRKLFFVCRVCYHYLLLLCQKNIQEYVNYTCKNNSMTICNFCKVLFMFFFQNAHWSGGGQQVKGKIKELKLVSKDLGRSS